jgi:hypothetical protein
MAKASSARVSKTSGSSISRGAYQKVYGMLRGDAPQAKSSGPGKIDSESRQYGKVKGTKPMKAEGFNVSYGDTREPTDLADVKALGEGKPPKSWKSDRSKAKIKGFK